jgi:cytochrome b6-f complex iron-sulfur subunit
MALPVLTGQDTSSGVTISIDSASPLATVGGAALVESGSRALLVARTGQNSFAALSAICTHLACVISGFGNGVYVCPCHGSQFTTSGSVVSGPASSPLPQFTATLSGATLTIAP